MLGTVIKMADDEDEEGQGNGSEKNNAGDHDDLFGLISVPNLGRYGDHRCIKDLKDYLLAVCGDKDTKKKLKSLLKEKASGVGLLVCCRFVNFPYETFLSCMRFRGQQANTRTLGLLQIQAVPFGRQSI